MHHTVASNPNIIWRRYFRYSGAVSAADAITLANNAVNSWAGTIQGVTTTNCQLANAVVTDLASATGSQATSTVAAVTGTSAGTQGPEDVAFIMKNRILRRYRGGHSRVYLPSPAMNLATAQTWLGTYITSVTSAYQNWLTNFTTLSVPAGVGTLTHVNVSYFSGFTVVTNPITHRARNVPSLRGAGPTVDTVTGTVANPKIGTQRRRIQQTP